MFLYIHVVAFAVALGCVLREDAKLVSRWPLDPHSLQEASRIVATASETVDHAAARDQEVGALELALRPARPDRRPLHEHG